MVLLEQLRIHVGGLVLLKTELFWYGGRGWDGITDRTVLLMDACAHVAPAARSVQGAAMGLFDTTSAAALAAGILLLIDGCPHWVWVSADDLELLQPGCNPSGGVV